MKKLDFIIKKIDLRIVLLAIAVIFLTIAIIISPLKLTVYSNHYYYSQFSKLGVYDNINKTQANEIADNLILFFQGSEELSNFNELETSHLIDVKSLLNKFMFVMNISLIIFLLAFAALIFINKEGFLDDIFKILFLSGLSAFAIIALIFLASLNFSITFQNFHEAFFSQGNYLFPEDSLMITLFPQLFFKMFLQKILLVSLFISFSAMIPQFILNKFKTKTFQEEQKIQTVKIVENKKNKK